MSDYIIKADNAVIRQQKNTILKDVNIEIKKGEFIYIIGKVGSGKSSFLKTLYAELPLEYGSIIVNDYQIKKIKKSNIPLLRRKCGIVFQDFKLLTDRTVYANLEFVLKATGWRSKKAIRERIDTVLEKVEMPNVKTKMPHELSGGEQQRVVLARALLNSPSLILADEPTGNIDPETSYRLVELLKDICATGKTIVIATHQYDLIEKYPGRVLRCENGTLTEDKNLSVIEPLQETKNETIGDSDVEEGKEFSVIEANIETPEEEIIVTSEEFTSETIQKELGEKPIIEKEKEVESISPISESDAITTEEDYGFIDSEIKEEKEQVEQINEEEDIVKTEIPISEVIPSETVITSIIEEIVEDIKKEEVLAEPIAEITESHIITTEEDYGFIDPEIMEESTVETKEETAVEEEDKEKNKPEIFGFELID